MGHQLSSSHLLQQLSYFLNHSDTPNCFWNEKDDSFYTLENIKIGEELTLDYNKYIVSDLVKNV